MNQAAKNVMKFLDQMKWEQANRTCAFHTDERDDAIIAGLELLRGVAEGTHVIVPIEPTPKQHEAGHKALDWYNKMTEQKQVQKRSICDTIYRSMITENE